MSNFIKLNREILDHWVFADEKTFKIWIWLLAKARYENGSIPLQIGKGQSVVELKRGQLLFGRFKAEESLNMDGSLIYRRLQKFESDGMIKIDSNNHYTIITICNYETWQGKIFTERTTTEQPLDSQQTTDEQPLNTYNNDKNIKKEKEQKTVFNLFAYLDLFNKLKGSQYTKRNVAFSEDNFKAWINEGYTESDFKEAILNALDESPTVLKYVTPTWLLEPKNFERYLNIDSKPTEESHEGKICCNSPEHSEIWKTEEEVIKSNFYFRPKDTNVWNPGRIAKIREEMCR